MCSGHHAVCLAFMYERAPLPVMSIQIRVSDKANYNVQNVVDFKLLPDKAE
jgi:hypothetical protein